MTAAFRFSDLLSQVGDTDSENKPLPPDTYTVVVEEAEAKIAESSGNPMIKVKFSVVGGPYNGKWVWNNFVLAINSAKGVDALKPFFRQMSAFGLDAAFFDSLGDQGLEAVAPLLIGKTVDIKTGIRPYNGKDYTDVKGVSKASAVTPGVPNVGVPTPQVPAPQVPQTPTAPAVPPVPATTPAPVPGSPVAPPPPPF